ncbi:MAG: hypothetical protein ACWGMZ_12110 [Thermoguttaceae bacterium]
MLYAYHGGGQVEFDEVIVKKILALPPVQNKGHNKTSETKANPRDG